MDESFKYKSEQEKDRINIEALTELPVNFSKRKKSLGWPMEIQGTGRRIEGSDKYEIKYPLGDIFISFAVIVHELGHIDQEENNPWIDEMKDGLYKKHYTYSKECDAFWRGIKRLKKYCPEVIAEIDEKFQACKPEGAIENFSTFEELYDYIGGIAPRISSTLNHLPEMEDEDEQDKLKYEALIEMGLVQVFEKLQSSKVGEIINREWAEEAIIKVMKKL